MRYTLCAHRRQSWLHPRVFAGGCVWAAVHETYAQGIPGLDVSDPIPLAEPGTLAHYVFESPWAVVILAVIAGGVLWMVLNSRQRAKHARIAAILCLLAGGACWTASTLVRTPRERMLESAEALVRAVKEGKPARARAVLTADAMLFSFMTPAGADLSMILDQIETSFGPRGPYRVREAAILERQAMRSPDGSGVVQLKIRASSEQGGVVFSWWRLDLQRESDGTWRVNAIMPLSITGMPNASGR